MRVLLVAPGPHRHGVVAHARTVTRLVRAAGAEASFTGALEDLPAADVLHVQFTDALFGRSAAAAAERFAQWARGVDVPLVATLHDVPGRDPDPTRDARRTEAYAEVLRSLAAVAVSAPHEADDLAGLSALRPVVVPLPVEPLPDPAAPPAWAGRTTVGVLGFVYPGKGHAEAVELVGRVAPDAAVVALGAASPGHEDLLDDLHRKAARVGVELLVTGTLTGSAMHAAARAVTVPLAAYRTLGASASLATWVAAGRRPVTRSSPYALGLAATAPDALLLHDDDALEAGLRSALQDPRLTWAPAPPPRPDVGGAHVALYRSVLA